MQMCSCSMTLILMSVLCVDFANCFTYLFRRNMGKLCDLEILMYGKLFLGFSPVVTLSFVR